MSAKPQPERLRVQYRKTASLAPYDRNACTHTCRDCHISEGLTAAMWDHMLGTKELFAFVFEGIRTPEDFENVRFKAANRERLRMLADDSKNCRSCHVMAAIQPERKRGQRQHKEAREEGITCIACHYNLVHKDVPPSDGFEEAISSQ